MKKNKTIKKGNSQKQLAKLLTASLVLNPANYLLPLITPTVQAAQVIPYNAPFAKNPLSDLIVGMGKTQTVNLTDYFSNVDNFIALSSGPEVSTLLSGSLLTLNGVQQGTATVSITGTKMNAGSITDTFSVSVIPDSLDQDHNNKVDISEVAGYVRTHTVERQAVKQALNFITPQQITSNTPPNSLNTGLTVKKGTTIKISPDVLFVDSDLNTLTFETFSLSTTGNLMASLSANQIILSGIQQGTLSLKATVNDGRGGKASGVYNLSVLDATYGTNQPPAWNGSLTSVTVTQNTYTTFNLNDAFKDPDGDLLSFNPVQVSGGDFVKRTQIGGMLTLYGNAVGSATVTASVYDGHPGGTAYGSFHVTVQSVASENHSPVLIGSPYAAFEIYHGQQAVVAVSDRFKDEDTDALKYTATTDLGGTLTVAAISGGVIGINGLPRGSNTVTLIADDGYGGIITDTVMINVQNNPPTFIDNPPPKYVASGQDHKISYLFGGKRQS